MKYECITIIANKHFGKIGKKTLQINIAVDAKHGLVSYRSFTVVLV